MYSSPPTSPDLPSNKEKLFFWLLLGAYSSYFAEVLSSSSPFVFFDAWGLIGVLPLYTLHTLFFASLIYRFGKPHFYTIFIAGAIFGMYEGILTKIIWTPTWGSMIPLAGFDLPSTLVLVLWWHPLLSFFVPLLFAEQAATRTSTVIHGLPPKTRRFLGRRRNMILVAIFLGWFKAALVMNPGVTLLSNLSTVLVLLILTRLWLRKDRGRYRFQDLLPVEKGFKRISLLLGSMYLIMGVGIRPEAFPGLGTLLLTAMIYLLLILLFKRLLRRSNAEIIPDEKAVLILDKPISNSRLWLILTITGVITSILFAPVGDFFALFGWLVGIITGIYLLISSIRYAFPRSSLEA